MNMLASPHQSFEYLDLPRVVEVVRCNPINLRLDRPLRAPTPPAEVGRFEPGNRVVEEPVLFVEQRAVAFPRCAVGRVWKLEPVCARAWECDLGIAQQPAADHAFPISGMEDEIPDAMTPGAWPPTCFAGADAAQRALERRAVPGRRGVGLIEDFEQQLDAGVHAYRSRLSSA